MQNSCTLKENVRTMHQHNGASSGPAKPIRSGLHTRAAVSHAVSCNNIPGIRKIRGPQAPHDPTHVTRARARDASRRVVSRRGGVSGQQTTERSFCPANLLFVFSV